MYVLVRLLKGFGQPLLYKIPHHLESEVSRQGNKFIGSVLTVPIRTQKKQALVLSLHKVKPPAHKKFEIKEACDLVPLPDDQNYKNYIEKVSRFYFLKPDYFYKRIRLFLEKAGDTGEAKSQVMSASGSLDTPESQVQLTSEQARAVQVISHAVTEKIYKPILLQGVTGSGKTEVYKKIITQIIHEQKSVIFLVPEVSLSRQFARIFTEQLVDAGLIPADSLYRFDSASTPKQKQTMWNKLTQKSPVLIIGVHLPVFLPMGNLGGIIIDEEHEHGFEEKKHPKINSKYAAQIRAQSYNIPIVLGSATPSLVTLAKAEQDNWDICKLEKRFAGKFPDIEHVLLSGRKRKNFWFSEKLLENIKQVIARKKQAIIYINRRGYSFFAQCSECGHVCECLDCSVSLTVHKREDRSELFCHYCDYKELLPESCPGCKSKKDLKQKGIGTQQVVSLLEKIFPEAQIARADTDISRRKKEWDQVISDFGENKYNILVGTQIITKGYHFPNVELVGLIWADSSLHFPVYNAHEIALQQMIQVAGRAGRVSESSKVIIQSFDDHQIFKYANEQKYLEFAHDELEIRKELSYPPYGRLVEIELKNTDPSMLDHDADKLAKAIKNLVNKHFDPFQIFVLGPAKPVVHKVQKTHVRAILIKAPEYRDVYKILNSIDISGYSSRIFYTPS